MKTALSALLLLAFAGCSREEAPSQPEAGAASDAKSDESKEEGEHETLPSTVELSEQVILAAGVKTAPVAFEALAPTLELTGEIAADPDQTASVVAQVTGRVVRVAVREGDRVRKGTVLAVLESPELARARAALTSAAARAAAARRNAERLETLAGDGMASVQERTVAEAEAKALEADAAAARQALAAFGAEAAEESESPARLALRAPLDGVVLQRNAVLGQVVGADTELVRLANLERAWFVARLFEKNLALVSAGKRADVRLNAYPDEVFPGLVEIIGKQLDPTARTVVARIAVRNRSDLLKVGLFGKARVAVPGTAGGLKLVVPLSAVTRLGEKDVVFVRQGERTFEVHPVTLGTSAEGKVEILEGLREGEVVAVDGVFTLKSVVLKSTFGEED